MASGSSVSEQRAFRVRAPQRPGRLVRLVRWVVFLSVLGAVAGFATITGAYVYFSPTVPQLDSIDGYQPKVGSRIYSADNQLIGEFAAERRVIVPFERIPPLLFKAFIAAEDKRFYEHGGLDMLGLSQAIFDKLRNPGSKLRGASTITQQVAKSLLAIEESYETATARSLTRKIREAILARRLESFLTKEEILYIYATQIFLGHKAYGVQAAAEHYFRKNVWELNLAEIATLAGLPQRPSDYSPVSRPDAAKNRRRYVLRRMLTDGYIDKAQHDEAAEVDLTVYPRNELYLQISPYYTEQVRREIVDRYGERAMLEDGLMIYTAMNIEADNIAQGVVSEGLYELDQRQGFRGPLAQLDTKMRLLFKAAYRKELGLAENAEPTFEKNDLYLGVVSAFDDEGKVAELDIAGRKGFLPLAGMRWARKPDPTARIDLHYLEDVRKALRVGDVIAVKATDRKTLLTDRHGWEVAASIPEEGDLFSLHQEPIANGALMSVDPRSGYVIAQVGGYSFEESSFNRATQACREPGSAFKPVVYSAAIDKLDYTASTLIDDKPIVFDDPDNEMRWKPANAEEEFRGSLPMRTCLMDSINTPAIRIAEAVGIEDTLKNARRLGIATPLKRELGTALGSSCTTLHDLMNVYVTLNRYGERTPLRFVRRVVDRYGNVLEDFSSPADPTLDLGSRLDRAYEKLLTPPARALDRQSAFLTVSLLRNVITNGTGVGASYLGHWVAGKTGTTNDSYDAWFMAFTKDLVTGVWVGHDKKERPLGVSEQGGRTALPLWNDFMGRYLVDYTLKPPKKMEQPPMQPPLGVIQIAIDPETGLLARPGSRQRVLEYYRAGSEPQDEAPDKAVLNPNHVDLFGADTPL